MHDTNARYLVCQSVASYIHSDSITYVDSRNNTAKAALAGVWQRVINVAEADLCVKVDVREQQALCYVPQASSTEAAIMEYLGNQSAFALAGIEHATATTKSVLLSVALRHIDIKTAALAASIESTIMLPKIDENPDAQILRESLKCDLALAKIIMM